MEKDKNIKQRIVYFDILNIIAIIAVISLHMNGIVHGNPNIRAWNTSLIIECILGCTSIYDDIRSHFNELPRKIRY